MAARNPAVRKSIATEAALTRWAHEDPKANAERGQAGLRAKFRAEIDAAYPDLSEIERARRADCAYRAHMVRLRRLRFTPTAS